MLSFPHFYQRSLFMLPFQADLCCDGKMRVFRWPVVLHYIDAVMVVTASAENTTKVVQLSISFWST